MLLALDAATGISSDHQPAQATAFRYFECTDSVVAYYVPRPCVHNESITPPNAKMRCNPDVHGLGLRDLRRE